jgi:hypothetical protein
VLHQHPILESITELPTRRKILPNDEEIVKGFIRMVLPSPSSSSSSSVLSSLSIGIAAAAVVAFALRKWL